jgi:hypothetical protein
VATTGQLIRELVKIERPEFVSFTYTAKGTGERARHLINVGFSMRALYERDVAMIEGILDGLGAIQRQAALAILNTRYESLHETGIGYNSRYTNVDTYEHVNGLLIHRDTDEVYIHGLSVKKKVLTPGQYRTRNSSPLVRAKNELMRDLPSGKLRQFDLGLVDDARMRGQTLVLRTSR